MDERVIEEQLRALLFVSGEGMSVASLSAVLNVDFDELNGLISRVIERGCGQGEGILITRIADKVRLCTNKAYAPLVARVFAPPNEQRFTNSVMETLSIIAYKQPVTRGEIEDIRGVRCDYAVSVLMDKGMVEECGRKDVVGRPSLLRTTDAFLAHFGISSLDELPVIDFSRYENDDGQTTLSL